MTLILDGSKGYSGPSSAEGGLGPNISVTNLNALKQLTTRPYIVEIQGYNTVNDGGNGIFIWNDGDTSVSDDVFVIQPVSGPIGRYKRQYDGDFNIKWFGVKGDGTTDDLTAINTALDLVSTLGGGRIYFPVGTYRISNTLIFGNGTNSSQSTKHHRISLIGSGLGTGPQASNITTGATRILYDGPTSNSNAVISIAGPIHSISIENMMLDANSKAGRGLIVNHCFQGSFKRITILRWSIVAYELTTRTGFPFGCAYGNAENIFEQCFSYDPINNTADGVRLTSGVIGPLIAAPDSARNTFIGGTIVYGGSTGSAGLRVAGADNNLFNATLFLPYGGNDGGGNSFYFEQWGPSPVFPLENTFVNCSGAQAIGGVSGTLGNTFWPLPTSDGIPPPTDPNLHFFSHGGFFGNLTKASSGGYDILELTPEQIRANVPGDNKGFAAYATGTPIFGLTRQANNAKLSSYDSVKFETGAITGPGSGTDRAVFDNTGLNVTGNIVASGTVTSLVGGDVIKVTNLASLKALIIRPSSIILSGRTSANDGGGGEFIWYPGDSTTPDDAITIQCTSGPSGRYKRMYSGYVNVDWFGAVGDGITNDTVAFNNAVSIGSITLNPAKNYALNNFNLPSGKLINGNGSNITVSVGADYAVRMTGYGSRIYNCGISDGNARTVKNTTVTTTVSLGATNLPVASSANFNVNNIIFVHTNSETLTSRIVSIPDSTHITIADPLPDNMASGRDVVTCRGVLVLEECLYGEVSGVIFANQPMAIEMKSISGTTGTAKNVICCFIDYTQLCGIALIGDVADNEFRGIQSWGGTWYKSGVPTIPKAVGFFMDARPTTLQYHGGNSWNMCRSLNGDYGAIVYRSDFHLWTTCIFDANAYWGLDLAGGANKHQFSNLWSSSNGLSGGGGVRTRDNNTIENLFNGLHGRFNGPSLVGPDINLGANTTIFLDEISFQENRTIIGSGTYYFHPSQSQFELGSASNPSISFKGDLNTGFFRETNDVIGIASGGSQAMSIDFNRVSFPSGPNDNFPGISFLGDLDTGIRRTTSNAMALISGGQQKLVIDSSNITATNPISTNSYVKSGAYTVGTLPSASSAGAGARTMVTDANSTTFLSTVAGGGSNIVPVVSDGTNWKIG